jgi:two-component system, cell cycle sensor histidine kinase and response regulator CckA
MPNLHILMVEDSDADAELAVHALRKAGITFSSTRVHTEAALRSELREHPPDVILSDYDLPGFDGISALMIARKLVPLTPFIVVSGSPREEVQSGCVKAGADAFLAKADLRGLGRRVLDTLSQRARSYAFPAGSRLKEPFLADPARR